jgi:hypothetical protein
MDWTRAFDKADILSATVPGAALMLGMLWIFDGSSFVAKLIGLHLGGLGALILASLAAGICIRMVAMTIFAAIGYTPRIRFDYLLRLLPGEGCERVAQELDSAFGVRFRLPGKTTLFQSRYWQASLLLSAAGQADMIARADEQFGMAAGLAVSVLTVSVVSAFFSVQNLHAATGLALLLALVLGWQASRWANAVSSTLIGWFSSVIADPDWKMRLRLNVGNRIGAP